MIDNQEVLEEVVDILIRINNSKLSNKEVKRYRNWINDMVAKYIPHKLPDTPLRGRIPNGFKRCGCGDLILEFKTCEFCKLVRE